MRLFRTVVGLAVGAALLQTASASALAPTLAERAENMGFDCQEVTSPDGVAYSACSAEIASFDGIGLETDLFLPAGATQRAPTIAMLHGWSQDKAVWEATTRAGSSPDTRRWNNVWFVSKGWASLNYTARGFDGSCGQSDSDPNCVDGYTHLAHRQFEVRDAQTLLGKLVDGGIANAQRLAATGNSYGGGQSWSLATSLPWESPGGVTLQLAAAVPKYPWTDLLDSLAPNGRATSGPDQSADHHTPFGVPKESYVDALYAAGRAVGDGRYDTNPNHPGTNLDLQYGIVQQGEPYDSKPMVDEIKQSFRQRSAYFANAFFAGLRAGTVDPVPVLSISGYTDPLFPPVQTLQMWRRLKAADPAYPVTMVFGDVGHSNAQNPAGQWHPINRLANTFLDAHVLGLGRPPAAQSYSFRTNCPAKAKRQPALRGNWPALARGAAVLTGAGQQGTAPNPNSADGAASDPIANMGVCLREDPGVVDPSGAYWEFAVPETGFTLVGLPVLRVDYAMTGEDATVGFKLWDQAADGSKILVTRGAYRLSTASGDEAEGLLRTELFGNHWRFRAGHTVVLQITQSDSPFLRPDNLPSQIEWSHPRLRLPLRQPVQVEIG